MLNSLNPENSGTEIVNYDAVEDGVKSISFKEGIVLMNIFSPRMINISGFLMKVFDIFAKNKVSVDLISTSEANISLTIDDASSMEADLEFRFCSKCDGNYEYCQEHLFTHQHVKHN